MDLTALRAEYDAARAYSASVAEGLDEAALMYRPHQDSSAMAWHLGHVAAVNHFMLRNLTAAEPSLDPRSDRVFDSALPEPQRGDLPTLAEIGDFRALVAQRTHATVTRISDGDVGAPAQLRLIAVTMLTVIINHEYQHSRWMAEVRAGLGGDTVAAPASSRLVLVDGYWLLPPSHLAEPVG
jgi:DinB superfamily